MNYTILIQISEAGISAGPFDIYYDTINPTGSLATGISAAQLVNGYYVENVPSTATYILLRDTGACNTITTLNI